MAPAKLNKRQDIINAAITIFLKCGYGAAAMEHIACEAEVSKRTLYKYFPNKEHLFDAIVERLLELAHSPDLPAYSSERDLEAQLREQCEAMVNLYANDTYVNLVRVVLGECINSKEQADRMMEGIAEYESDLLQWIKQATADNQLNIQDADIASNHLIQTLKSFCLWPQLFCWAPPPEDSEIAMQLDIIVRNFLHCYQATS